MSSTVATDHRTDRDREFHDLLATVFDRFFDCPFFLFDALTRDSVAGARPEAAIQLPDWLVNAARVADLERVAVQVICGELQVLTIPVGRGNRPELLALGVLATRPLTAAEQQDVSRRWRINLPADSLSYCQPRLLQRLGREALATIADQQKLHSRENELRQLASQLTRNYEEITLLHQLTREAQVSHGVRTLQELTLSLLSELLGAPQLVYLDAESGAVLVQGRQLLVASQCQDLVRVVGERARRGALVENHLARHAWSRDFAAVGRLIVVPVADRNEQFGWLIALATADQPELGSVEASLMTAVAAILATHHTNVKLYGNIKDLFLGVVRALSSAIDAKDPYTCGHSERVARIARRIGQALELSDDECNRIYLSGLLHDVGKIGIRDAVLLKPGRLEPDEWAHIQEHPRIGYEILSGVRQLRAVLAGVRSHHENFDGTGYPDRLGGEQIPLMARILAVADSYDAMSSDRPYRKGLDEQQVECIFHEGMDKQWDRRVVQKLLALRHEFKVGSKSNSGAKAVPASSTGNGSTAQSQPIDLSKVSKLISFSTR